MSHAADAPAILRPVARPIRRLLVANRGEIACRILRTARDLGIATVAVHGAADRHARHVGLADEAVWLGDEGGGIPYLDGQRLIAAAHATGADAIHPGYGFLAERADFASAVIEAGLTWVGPPPAAMATLGRKDRARAEAAAAGVPVVPGVDGKGLDDGALATAALALGFPLLIKASSGGGGRGMRRVACADELAEAIALARAEAVQAFGDGDLLVERWVERGHHVEVQIFGDAFGHVAHFGERECSVQRRHQKVFEETPSPNVDAALRVRMVDAALRLGERVSYQGAGTVEFLLDGDSGAFYFLEVNTRIQVEHPVTELVTGVDLVAWQLAVAAGQPLPCAQADIHFAGHAIEARLCAEDPADDYRPQSGDIACWQPAQGEGVRVDHGLLARDRVSPHYDSLLAKVIAWGADRPTALLRLRGALQETVLLGPRSNRGHLLEVLDHPDFLAGRATTAFLTECPPQRAAEPASDDELLAATLWRHGEGLRRRFRNNPHRGDVTILSESGGSADRLVYVCLEGQGGDQVAFAVDRAPDPSLWRLPRLAGTVRLHSRDDDGVCFERDGVRRSYRVVAQGSEFIVQARRGRTIRLSEGSLLPEPTAGEAPEGVLTAPAAATVAVVHVAVGDLVAEGAALVTLEAMKMLTIVRAPRAGVIAAVQVTGGETVAAGTMLIELQPEEGAQ